MTSTEDTEELRRTVRRFLDQRGTEPVVRRLMEDEVGYDPATWRQMADQLGLQGLAIAEEYGGSDFTFAELCVVFQEFGRSLMPSPLFGTVALAATALQQAGDTDAMKAYLPGIASGETIATLAVSEGHGGWTEDVVAARADHVDGEWRLTGSKRFVLDPHIADLVLVAARTDAGVSLFAVEKGAPGLTTEVELTMDLTRKLGVVGLDSTPARLVGADGQAWDAIRRTLLIGGVALAAEQVGGAQRVLDMTVEYAKTRIQFGRPIGSFQAIKHRLADVLVEVENAKSAALDAARAIAEGDDDMELAASVAKAYCSDAYFHAADAGVHIHGGIGFTWEHAAHLYFKRAKSSQFLLGSPDHHRALIGQALGV